MVTEFDTETQNALLTDRDSILHTQDDTEELFQ